MSQPGQAAPLPNCPGGDGAPFPDHAAPGAPPNTFVWRDIGPLADARCGITAPVKLVVAMAAGFRHVGTADDLAARLGAISTTAGLRYWSTTDGKWRELVEAAYAVEAQDHDRRRRDFTPEELAPGVTRYFAQRDTRSSGTNIYALTVTRADPDHFWFEIVNASPIRMILAILFEPGALVSRHFFSRADGAHWSYYGLSKAADGLFLGSANSYLNRADAFYRFLTGRPADQGPPLAP